MGKLHIVHSVDDNPPAMLWAMSGREKRPSIGENDTFQKLVAEVSSVPCENSEFVELNKIRMVELGPMDDQDYSFFWGCMKLYEKYRANYFAWYLSLRRDAYGDFSHGIEQWIKEGHDKNELREVVNILHFFGISSYQGITLDSLESSLASFGIHERNAYDLLQEEYNAKANKTITGKLNSYFNFASFDRAVFKNYLDPFTVKQVHKEVLLNEALNEAKTVPVNTYIVILYKDGKACYVGKTEHLLKYIGDKSQKYNADKVFYHVADSEYVDDLVIAIMIYYDLPLTMVRPKSVHRKYATVQQACYAYRYADSIPKKTVLSAIEKNHLRTYEIDAKNTLIDKTELEDILRPSLSMH